MRTDVEVELYRSRPLIRRREWHFRAVDARIEAVLDQVEKRAQAQVTTVSLTENMDEISGPDRKVTASAITPGSVTDAGKITHCNLSDEPLDPDHKGPFTIGDMDDAPAEDGRPGK